MLRYRSVEVDTPDAQRMSFWSSDLDTASEGLEGTPSDLAAWLRDVGRSTLGEGEVGDAYDTSGYGAGYDAAEAGGSVTNFGPGGDVPDPYATPPVEFDVPEEGSA
jgi:hypothetical protein